MTAEPERFPWDDDPEFDRIMRAYERTHPVGPAQTATRRAIMWRIYQEPAWNVPDDPFDATAWLPGYGDAP